MSRTQRKLLQDLKQFAKPKRFPFLNTSLAFFSILYGLYVWFNPGHIESTLNEALHFISEDAIAYLMVFSGTLKLIGLASMNGLIKRLSIVLITVCWSLLFIISAIYAFGIGYPSPNFITYAYLVVSCLRASYKEDYT